MSFVRRLIWMIKASIRAGCLEKIGVIPDRHLCAVDYESFQIKTLSILINELTPRNCDLLSHPALPVRMPRHQFTNTFLQVAAIRCQSLWLDRNDVSCGRRGSYYHYRQENSLRPSGS